MLAIVSSVLEFLRLIQHELLLFAAFWFVVGIVDEALVDLAWLGLRLRGKGGDIRLPAGFEARPLAGRTAVFIPTWREDRVIGHTVSHALSVWPQADLMLYVGCYANDPATVAAAMAASAGDTRLRIVVHDNHGPTTKADCLNRLYAALAMDEERSGRPFATVLLHDAEDMVHPAELALVDRVLADADFVQIPVRPEPQPASPWVAGHYTDEFAEQHGKAMVVRDALGASIPAAGVGCGFSRKMLARIAAMRGAGGEVGPFAAECLTEDYELGVLVARVGGRSRFVRARDADGALVATRAYFPPRLDAAVRQKTRWIHGIALQGWDRLGWAGRWSDLWMALRDRRGPMMALVLAAGYALLVIEGVLSAAELAGWADTSMRSPLLQMLVRITLLGFLWRAAWRFGFTAREYGVVEGLRAVLRIPVANLIAILAARRAIWAYVGVLRGEIVHWDKTDHDAHPAMLAAATS